jgi:hypothetical protein
MAGLGPAIHAVAAIISAAKNNSSYEILILKERVFSWIAGTSPAMTPSGAPIAEVIRASAADFRVRTPRIGYGVQPFMRALYQFW